MTIETYSPQDLFGELTEFEEKNAPEKLYLEGDSSLVTSGLRISVVGSRKASDEGIRRARVITKALVKRNIVVVSGLAAGIDTIAHKTALDEGGRTVAVLGTPLDKIYPVKNRSLLENIKRDHLAISQFPIGYPSKPNNFPMRNRTMALISDATIIVEAGDKSGTLHQGWEALRLGRLLFLLDSVVKNSKSSWPSEMIKYGAQILDREVLGQALDEMPSFTTSTTVDF